MPALPTSVYPVSVFRDRLRSRLRDTPLADPANPSQYLDTVFTDADLDEGLREALTYVSQYIPAKRALPPLSLVAGQQAYDLPADFLRVDESSWDFLIGPSPAARGTYPGSRYGNERMQGSLEAASPFRGYGAQFGGYPAFWQGGVGMAPMGAVPFNSQGQISPGSMGEVSVQFLEPDATHPNPRVVFTPAPALSSSAPITTLYYWAADSVLRLTADGSAWAVDGSGLLVTTPVYASDTYADATDILSVGVNSDKVRLLLCYATHWVLQSKILDLADSDGDTYAFYAHRSGMTRDAISALAKSELRQVELRTRFRAVSARG